VIIKEIFKVNGELLKSIENSENMEYNESRKNIKKKIV